MILHFDLHDRALLIAAMSPPWLLRDLDEATSVPVTDGEHGALHRAHLAEIEDGPALWAGWEPSYSGR